MDEKLEYFKKKILAHLDDLEQKENAEKKELKKSLLAFEMTSIEKAGYPVGTIREWKGKKYIKVAPGKWKPKYDSHSRGAKMAIAALKKKIDACTDSEELMQIILENRDRFSDENGRPLPFVKELSDYISGRNDTIESEKNEKKATETMYQNEQDKGEDIPVDEKDMGEAENIIGADVKRILEGRDTFGNAKQGLVDKIKRRIRNNPGVARAMLVYIQKEQEKTGKKVFTDKHSIWEELPKLNENARKAKANGESETKTGVSGNLYEGEDGTTVVENKDWGRYQISFPGKPDGETISMLKRNGFRWSPSTKTWVCFNTANGEYSLKRVAEKLGLKKNDEVKKSLFDSLEDSFPYDDEMDSEDEIKKAVADVLDELAQGDK